MAKPEWGKKRTGPCGTKFYDFNKSPIICPGCGGEVIINEINTKTKKNDLSENAKSNNKEQILTENKSEVTEVLDSNIFDDDIVNDDVNLEETVEDAIEDNMTDDEEVNLIEADNDIALDVEIDENEHK